MSTFHLAASSLANFNDTISTISTTRLFIRLLQLFSSKKEPTFVMASQLTLFGDSMVNIKSTQRAFGFFSPAEYAVMYTCYQRGVAVLGGVVNFLPFIIKRILGIKRIFPCSFGNKRMRLLTRVYGTLRRALIPRTRTVRSNNGHAYSFAEAPCFLAPQR